MFTLSISVLFKALFAFILTISIYRIYFHPLTRYPGPFLARLTNLWKFSTFLGGNHHRVEEKLHEKYGHVVRVGPNSLSFSSLADFEAIYGFNKGFEKGEFYSFGRDTSKRTENIFSARTDASHREHRRKVVGPALTAPKISSYEPVVSKNVSALLSRLGAAVKDKSTVNVADIIHRFTFDTVVEIIYGDQICTQPYTDLEASADILPAFRNMSKMAWGGSLLPWFGRLMATAPMAALIRKPTFDSKGNMTSISALAANSRALIFKHPEMVLKSTQPSIVRNYLEVPDSDSKRMQQNQIWGEAFNLVFAGPGSTAAALTGMLYQLGQPDGRDWQARIRNEAKDNEKMMAIQPVLLAVIKESLRFRVPFPTAFPRVVTKGAESAIPDLPAPLPVGTVVSAHTHVLSRSKAIWGEDAGDWNPERWLVDESERRALDDQFVVFSKGARMCIGKDIAMMMLAEATVEVLKRWDIRAVGDLKGKSWLEMQYEQCDLAFSGPMKG